MDDNVIVLLDKDKTLVDVQYKLTAPINDLVGIVAKLQQQHRMCVGLNSDSPYLSLKGLHHEVQMQGPIISERGAMLHWPIKSLVERTGPEIVENCTRIADKLSEALQNNGSTVFSGDPGYILSELAARQHWEKSIIINTLRTCSVCFYARKRSAYEVLFDNDLLDEAVCMLKVLLQNEFPNLLAQAEFDVNREYGICILHSRYTNKLLAANHLLEQCGVSKIYMIGDSMSDYMHEPRIIHLAVANATPEFKNVSSYVAEHSITEGVIELLWHINNSFI